MKRCELKSISQNLFSRYGCVIEHTEDHPEDFQIIAIQAESGWRLAVFRVRNSTADCVERHPVSMESFEPLSGAAVLIVAQEKIPDEFEAFLLDRPVCLYQGVWHQILSIPEFSDVKITENLEVGTEFHRLEDRLTVSAGPSALSTCGTEKKEE